MTMSSSTANNQILSTRRSVRVSSSQDLVLTEKALLFFKIEALSVPGPVISPPFLRDCIRPAEACLIPVTEFAPIFESGGYPHESTAYCNRF